MCEHQPKTCSAPGQSGQCLEPTGECECSTSATRIEVDILTDDYPGETTWKVTDKCGSSGVILSGGTYSSANTLFSKDTCAVAGQYDFTINVSEEFACAHFSLSPKLYY